MSKPMIEIYITKHALTSGIEIVQAEISEGMASWKPNGAWCKDFAHGEGRDWHRDRVSAERRAEEMRIKKIAALKKKIAKLEKMSFVGTE